MPAVRKLSLGVRYMITMIGTSTMPAFFAFGILAEDKEIMVDGHKANNREEIMKSLNNFACYFTIAIYIFLYTLIFTRYFLAAKLLHHLPPIQIKTSGGKQAPDASWEMKGLQ